MRGAGVMLLALVLYGCSREARKLGPELPQTAPAGNSDPRISSYQDNFYQLSEGGRYFSWYGCSLCHGEDSVGDRSLADSRWIYGGGFADVYRAIVQRHPEENYASRIASEQLWQITAYVRDLPGHHPEKRRRLFLDQRSEAQGDSWRGPQ